MLLSLRETFGILATTRPGHALRDIGMTAMKSSSKHWIDSVTWVTLGRGLNHAAGFLPLKREIKVSLEGQSKNSHLNSLAAASSHKT